jgi:hypothetical protein
VDEHTVVNSSALVGEMFTNKYYNLTGFRFDALQLTCIRRSDQCDVHTFAHYLATAPVLQVPLEFVAQPLDLRQCQYAISAQP